MSGRASVLTLPRKRASRPSCVGSSVKLRFTRLAAAAPRENADIRHTAPRPPAMVFRARRRVKLTINLLKASFRVRDLSDFPGLFAAPRREAFTGPGVNKERSAD